MFSNCCFVGVISPFFIFKYSVSVKSNLLHKSENSISENKSYIVCKSS